MAMTNAEWMVTNGHKFSDLNVRYKGPGEYNSFVVRLNGEKLDEFELGKGQTLIEFALKKWLDEEHKEPILDEAEKKYLSAVIKPFRDDVRDIRKIQSIYRLPDDGKEYIKICMCTGEEVNFPYYRKGSMYNGMETGKRYTLEELGL